MKIYYIGKFDKLWNEEGVALGLEANGCEVIRANDGGKAEDYLLEISQVKPDFVLFAKLDIDEPLRFIKKLRDMKVPSVSWTFDLLIGHPYREQHLESFPFLKADYVFLTDGGHKEEYRKIGVEPITVRQGIPDDYYYKGEYNSELDFDIVFVGTENRFFPYRTLTMKFLQENYPKQFKWIGRGNDEEMRGDKLNELYASSKIIIGDYMYAPHYWSNRVYETLGRGGFMIAPRIDGIEEHYTPYEDFIPYDWGDYVQLGKKIDYFLAHPEEREKIKDNAFKKSINHTWKVRTKEFLDKYETCK